MPPISVRTAAQRTGKDRSTITRAIENGRLSATRDARGRYLIEPAELQRVFGTTDLHAQRTDAGPPFAAAPHEAAAVREHAVLRELLERERAAYERERRSWEDERAFLRAMVKDTTSALARLADRTTALKRGFGCLRRLFGSDDGGGKL